MPILCIFAGCIFKNNMGKTVCFNAAASIFENSQKSLQELFGDFKEVEWYEGWTLADLSLCNGPAIQKRIKKRIVKYNLPERRIYIEDIGSCLLNDACGIYLDIKWQH